MPWVVLDGCRITELMRGRVEALLNRSGEVARHVPIWGCEVSGESRNQARESALAVLRLMSDCETSGFGPEQAHEASRLLSEHGDTFSGVTLAALLGFDDHRVLSRRIAGLGVGVPDRPRGRRTREADDRLLVTLDCAVHHGWVIADAGTLREVSELRAEVERLREAEAALKEVANLLGVSCAHESILASLVALNAVAAASQDRLPTGEGVRTVSVQGEGRRPRRTARSAASWTGMANTKGVGSERCQRICARHSCTCRAWASISRGS
jgi:hypothetical protein